MRSSQIQTVTTDTDLKLPHGGNTSVAINHVLFQLYCKFQD